VSRLERLRDGAPLHMLESSGMRREGIRTLNRADVEDGWKASAVIIGKGSKERTVFWDTETQHALKLYLAARTDPYPPRVHSPGQSPRRSWPEW
jgi:integrase/recombinase XerD